MIVRVLALPVIAGVGFLGWQLPRSHDAAPQLPSPVQGPPGAAPMGSTAYPVPDGALFVSPSGNDGADGTRKHPLRTLARAVAKAHPGGTVVLRGGVYHESVTVPGGKKLTIQSAPREAVWLDGSSPVGGWRAGNDAWVREGWTTRFDASPTYTAGAKASGDGDFQFVSPDHPMAAHPDQVWLDGAPQRQVGARADVKPGTFYVDEGARRLYLGSDPRGHDVRASTLSEAITVGGAGSRLRGLGVRRYATSLPQLGSVKVTAPRVTVENVAVDDSATTGLSVLAAHARVRHVTADGNGMLGVHANYADDLRLEGVRSTGNNAEHFKYSPVSGGVKVTRSRQVAVTGGVFADNLGKGVWMDESVYDITLTGNRILRNADHGVSLELSAKAVVAGNVIGGNAGDGLKVNNTSDVQIWNNSMAGNGRTIHLAQDPRSPSDPHAAGRDPRQKNGDPAMTWQVSKVVISNNTLADARPRTPCLLCVEDGTHRRGGGQMGLTVDGNVYVRPDGNPHAVVRWARGSGGTSDFTDLGRFRSETGQEKRGVLKTTGGAAGQDGALERSFATQADTGTALPLPAPIAALLNKPTGTRHVGAWTS
ncbi:right-handed parallel beta-helix repeat-containing protein [Actinomadura opuntiae]|uniref:right-handed parallel beta-helix repeat-containing protein n=1 Tax=Actinomadura sp. OS1-43 TaxID=604315 RepID=UPI00255AD788|nr:right-handed parallel beta-helix repeat-containing protein [Actinomadura sp. OS1-43]MDL4815683.1 right-handed parallel beta-helix repeat-containing protein [Actinomadura sp. OS1-43]